ncbi:hypothetical protein P7C70_g8306, partial [Phenoliferia sp. Uapishka_3]
MSVPTASTSEAVQPASLHPVKLSKVPAHWSETSSLRHKLSALENDVSEYDKLATKLETITDQVAWDAMIPLGPLAYFPGQLIHTNDITITRPSPLPPPESGLPTPPTIPAEGQLLSAKQARQTAQNDKASLKALVEVVKDQLQKAEDVAREKAGEDGLEEGWALNDKGEVINEEGLPMFDIREELPYEEEAEKKDKEKTEAVKPKEVKPQMRYLIKKGGKQIV